MDRKGRKGNSSWFFACNKARVLIKQLVALSIHLSRKNIFSTYDDSICWHVIFGQDLVLAKQGAGQYEFIGDYILEILFQSVSMFYEKLETNVLHTWTKQCDANSRIIELKMIFFTHMKTWISNLASFANCHINMSYSLVLKLIRHPKHMYVLWVDLNKLSSTMLYSTYMIGQECIGPLWWIN